MGGSLFDANAGSILGAIQHPDIKVNSDFVQANGIFYLDKIDLKGLFATEQITTRKLLVDNNEFRPIVLINPNIMDKIITKHSIDINGTIKTYQYVESSLIKEITDDFEQYTFIPKRELSINVSDILVQSNTNKNISNTEYDNLLKLIGVLTKALADKSGKKYGTKDKPNFTQIEQLLSDYHEGDYGLGKSTIKDKMSQGVQILNKNPNEF